MQKRFKTAGVGGTFDELHKGHEALLRKAFEISEHVLIGVSSDEFVKRMSKPHYTANYEDRLRELKRFLEENGFLDRAEIFSIDDIYGGVLLSTGPVEALVVSRETEKTALDINEKRERMGLRRLVIIVIDMIPSRNHRPISTTRIREGEIDREGHLLRISKNNLK